MPILELGLGGGMIFSGLMNALVSSVNSRHSLAANAEQQQKNQEFQVALQQKQWKHAEGLQKEMREMTRQNFLEQLAHQREVATLQMLQQHWPLPSTSPRLIIDEFNEYLKANRPIPLQLIIVENGDLGKGPLAVRQQVRNAINELNKFMSSHYGQNSEYAVKVYDSNKSGTGFGSSEVDTIFQIFKVAPTMILTIRVCGSEYVLECWHWGSGQVERPVMVEVFRCDIDDLQRSVLKHIADKWKDEKARLGVEDSDKDALVDLLSRIEDEIKKLVQRGATESEVREYAYKPFRDELSGFVSLSGANKGKSVDARPFIQKINASIEDCIFSSLKISAALLSDAHFLLEKKAAPRFLQLCSEELSSIPGLMNQAQEFFSSVIKSLPAYRGSEIALMHAKMASAYQKSNYSEMALLCSRESSQQLELMVAPQNFALEANEDMLQSINELKRINGIAQAVPWVVAQSSHEYSADELNKHAISLYRSGRHEAAISIWKKAAKQGHLKSQHNLGNVLESLGKIDEAYEVFTAALEKGYTDLFKRGHQLALWHCRRGSWSKAFSMWAFYLQSGDAQYRYEAEAYSSLLIFTDVIAEITEGEYLKWASLMEADKEMTPQQFAEDFLLSKATADSQIRGFLTPFFDALSVWYLRSKGVDISILPGISDNVKFTYRLPHVLPREYEKLFQHALSLSGRPDIQTIKQKLIK